tara:strand:+ start:798 stop:1556 length:759 start_codon:yes stop_codon:yes gene_type:complete
MFSLIASLTEDWAIDFHDDGTAQSPMLRTFYTAATLQNARTVLGTLQDGIDDVISAWSKGVRYSRFDLTNASGSGLVRIVHASRSLYSLAGTLVYSDQVWRYRPGPCDELTPQYKLLERVNQLRASQILIGGARPAPLVELETLAGTDLLVAGGFHNVGTRAGNNILQFSDSELDEELLIQLHTDAADGIDACTNALGELEALRDVPIALGEYMERWSRVWRDIYAHIPVPFGVEPGESYRMAVDASEQAAE